MSKYFKLSSSDAAHGTVENLLGRIWDVFSLALATQQHELCLSHPWQVLS